VEQIVFGSFCLDAETGRLLRDGVDLDLRPQAFRALRALLHHRGRFLDSELLMREAWGKTVVSRHTVAVTVGEAKKALQEYGSWISYRPKLGYCLDVPGSADLLRTGWHLWSRRTREGARGALECFHLAAEQDASDFRPFEGIAACYLMLGAYGMNPPLEMYRGFLKAHRKAVELHGLSPELRADRAFGMHLFERRFEEAERELKESARRNPGLASTYVRLAMLCVSEGRFDDAQRALEQGYRADALWPLLPATELSVRFYRRDYESAVVCGKRALELHPYLQLGHAFYGQALEFSGRLTEALEQYQASCALCPDLPWLRALEGACLARSGRTEDALRILCELERVREEGYVDAYYVAALLAALGKPKPAIAELERAFEENSPTLTILDVDPKLDSLRADPHFARLRQRVMCGPALAALAEAG
jgi:DNA-binding winged helix-turn-helix (wHTH) protein/Flp pilus assembly protein TadD